MFPSKSRDSQGSFEDSSLGILNLESCADFSALHDASIFNRKLSQVLEKGKKSMSALIKNVEIQPSQEEQACGKDRGSEVHTSQTPLSDSFFKSAEFSQTFTRVECSKLRNSGSLKSEVSYSSNFPDDSIVNNRSGKDLNFLKQSSKLEFSPEQISARSSSISQSGTTCSTIYPSCPSSFVTSTVAHTLKSKLCDSKMEVARKPSIFETDVSGFATSFTKEVEQKSSFFANEDFFSGDDVMELINQGEKEFEEEHVFEIGLKSCSKTDSSLASLWETSAAPISSFSYNNNETPTGLTRLKPRTSSIGNPFGDVSKLSCFKNVDFGFPTDSPKQASKTPPASTSPPTFSPSIDMSELKTALPMDQTCSTRYIPKPLAPSLSVIEELSQASGASSPSGKDKSINVYRLQSSENLDLRLNTDDATVVFEDPEPIIRQPKLEKTSSVSSIPTSNCNFKQSNSLPVRTAQSFNMEQDIQSIDFASKELYSSYWPPSTSVNTFHPGCHPGSHFVFPDVGTNPNPLHGMGYPSFQGIYPPSSHQPYPCQTFSPTIQHNPVSGPLKLSVGYTCLGGRREVLYPLVNTGHQLINCQLVPVASFVNNEQVLPQDISFVFPNVQIPPRSSKNANISLHAKLEGTVNIWMEIQIRNASDNSMLGSFLCNLSLVVEKPRLSISSTACVGTSNVIEIGTSPNSSTFESVILKISNEGRSTVPLIIHLVTNSKGSLDFMFSSVDHIFQKNAYRYQWQPLLPTVALCHLGGCEGNLPSEIFVPITAVPTSAQVSTVEGRVTVSLQNENSKLELGVMKLRANISLKRSSEEYKTMCPRKTNSSLDLPAQECFKLKISRRQLYFGGINIGKKKYLKLVAKNCSHILYQIQVSIAENGHFSLIEESNHIQDMCWDAQPSSSKNLTVCFAPTSLSSFNSTLNIIVSDGKDQFREFEVPLWGYGCTSHLLMVYPLLNEAGESHLEFRETKRETIKLTNDGLRPAFVICNFLNEDISKLDSKQFIVRPQRLVLLSKESKTIEVESLFPHLNLKQSLIVFFGDEEFRNSLVPHMKKSVEMKSQMVYPEPPNHLKELDLFEPIEGENNVHLSSSFVPTFNKGLCNLFYQNVLSYKINLHQFSSEQRSQNFTPPMKESRADNSWSLEPFSLHYHSDRPMYFKIVNHSSDLFWYIANSSKNISLTSSSGILRPNEFVSVAVNYSPTSSSLKEELVIVECNGSQKALKVIF